MKNLIKTLEKTFMAAAFAEENCHEMATEILDEKMAPRGTTLADFLRDVGLSNVRYSYVMARV